MTLNQYYFKEKPIGKGAYATVYEALNLKNNQVVAIKVINRIIKSSELKLVKKEIAILMAMKHPNIISMREYIQRGRTWYLVLDYCPGGNLAQYLKKQIQLNEKQVQGIAYHLGLALQYLEAKKIAHRDLKLANILIDQKGIVRIGDLGFAKSTQNGQILQSKAGTESTMAPQILNRNGEMSTYTTKCDIWSFGIVLYELLVAKNPFYGYKQAVSFDKLTFPSTVKISKEGKDFIKRCLTVDPVKRISAYEILRHPWILNFMSQNSPQYLKSRQLNIQSSNYNMNNYSENRIKQILLQEYDLAIIGAISLFKIQYSNKLDYLKTYSQKMIYYMRKLKYNELVGSVMQTLGNKLNQLQVLNTTMQLPSKSFEISKHCEDLVKKSKQMLHVIVNNISIYIKEIKFDQKQTQKILESEQKLIYQLLKKGDNIAGISDQYQMLWSLIKYVCKFVQLQFGSFIIKLSYHQTLTPDTIKFIESIRSFLSKQQLATLISSKQQEKFIQKLDVLTSVTRLKPSNKKKILSDDLLNFLIQTACLD